MTEQRSLTDAQIKQLLEPINPKRVVRDGKGHNHVSQQDVLAHLIRVFGFGNFDTDVLNVECIFENPRDDAGKRFDVCYRAMVRLTIRTPDGVELCHYENGSTATAQNQTRGDAHDLAYKSSISLSIKRAAIALGDQFGLSLYNKGQMSALVLASLVGADHDGADVQSDVPQQVALGNDEVDHADDAVTAQESDADQARSELLATLKFKGVAAKAAGEKFRTDTGSDLNTTTDVAAIKTLTAFYRSVPEVKAAS